MGGLDAKSTQEIKKVPEASTLRAIHCASKVRRIPDRAKQPTARRSYEDCTADGKRQGIDTSITATPLLPGRLTPGWPKSYSIVSFETRGGECVDLGKPLRKIVILPRELPEKEAQPAPTEKEVVEVGR
jgi:hypothetical protein